MIRVYNLTILLKFTSKITFFFSYNEEKTYL